MADGANGVNGAIVQWIVAEDNRIGQELAMPQLQLMVLQIALLVKMQQVVLNFKAATWMLVVCGNLDQFLRNIYDRRFKIYLMGS